MFLGFNRMSSEYLLWDEGNVVKARAIQRFKKSLRWHIAAYNSVGPNCLYDALEHEKIVGDLEKVKDPSAEGELSRKPQNVQIRHADWLRTARRASRHWKEVADSRADPIFRSAWSATDASTVILQNDDCAWNDWNRG